MPGGFREYVLKWWDRSPLWPKVRKAHLAEHPRCEACGKKGMNQVHHEIPVHVAPEKELDRDNLITLCGDCHFVFGHLWNWVSWNTAVRATCNQMRMLRLARPK